MPTTAALGGYRGGSQSQALPSPGASRVFAQPPENSTGYGIGPRGPVDISTQGTVRTANSDATIVSQINASSAGDTVQIAAGTYGYITITKNIASGNIRVVPASYGVVTVGGWYFNGTKGIDVRGLNSYGSDGTDDVWFANAVNCTWRGGNHNVPATATAFTVRAGCSGILVEDATINNALNSFEVQGFSETGRATDVTFKYNRSNNVAQDHFFLSRGDHIYVDANECFGHTESTEHTDGVQIVGAKDVYIRRNHFWNPREFRNSAVDLNDHGIIANYDPAETPEGRVPERITVENNLIHDMTSTGIAVAGCLGIVVNNNTVYDNGKPSSPGLALSVAPDSGNTISGLEIRNNIFDSTAITGVSPTVNTNNFVADASGPSGTSELTGAPGFSGATNYNLAVGSQNIGSGTSITSLVDIFGLLRTSTPSRGAIEPALATVAAESFTAPPGTAWSAVDWTIYKNGAGTGTALIQSNRGVLTTGPAAYSDPIEAYWTSAPSLADAELFGKFTTETSLLEQYLTIGLRTTTSNTGGSWPNDGYFVEISQSGSTMDLRRDVAGVSTVLAGGVAVPSGFATSTTYSFRLRTEGSVVRFRMWIDVEPSTWLIDYTDGTPYSTGGYPFLSAQNGSPTATRSWVIDSLELRALTSSQSASLAATATASATIAATREQLSTLSATATASATVAGVRSQLSTLSATATASATIAGTREQPSTLAATAPASATIAGTQTFIRALAATATASATVAGTQTFFGSVAATAVASAAIAGLATISPALSAFAPASATIAGVLTQPAALSASATATAASAGIRSQVAALAATAPATATVDGIKTVSAALAATAVSSATIAGVGTRIATVAATAVASATIAGVQTQPAALVATAPASATIAPTVIGQNAVEPVALASVTIAATQTQAAALSASAPASAAIAGLVTHPYALSASATATAAVAGIRTQPATLAATALASAVDGPSRTAIAAVASVALASASVAGLRQTFSAVAATAVGTSTISGTRARVSTLTATATATCAVTGTTTRLGALSPVALATATSGGGLVRGAALAATALAQAAILGEASIPYHPTTQTAAQLVGTAHSLATLLGTGLSVATIQRPAYVYASLGVDKSATATVVT